MNAISRFVAALACAAMACPASAQAAAPIDWQADLQFLVQQLKLRHPQPFHDITEAEFDARSAALSQRIGTLTDWQAAVELQRLLASLNEGHTALRYIQPEFGAEGFPVRFQAFSDGIVVQAIDREHADLVGAQLVAIDSTAVADLVASISELISADNESAARRQIPFLLSVNVVLHGLGIIQKPDSATYTLRKLNGDVRRITVASRPVPEVETLLEPGADLPAGEDWIRLRDAASAAEPLWLKRPRDLYWFEHLPDSGTFYVQINRLYNRGKSNFTTFAHDAFTAFDSVGAKRLVVDLRRNGGGDHIDLPFVHEIVRRPALQERGRLLVLTSGATFSAAQTFVNHLAEHANPIFVGESTGQRPNMFGVVGTFKLPSSGLRVSHSRYFIQGSDPADYRLGTEPDLPVAYNSSDYANNHDPVLAAAIEFASKPVPDLAQVMTAAYESGGIEAAVRAYHREKPIYAAQAITTEAIINRLGYALLREGKVDEAVRLFRLNVEAYPRSFNTYDSLAEGLLASGQRSEALAVLRTALDSNPSNLDARRRLKIMELEATRDQDPSG